MSPIPYGKQWITQNDIDAVVAVLKSDYLTQGPKIKEFEEVFAAYVGADYAVAVANGTGALHLSALALNVKPGDKVITTPITFAASANCVRYCGGEVVFADIDPETFLLDIHCVRKLVENSPRGTYAGIIPVDFAGRAIDLEAYRKLADEFGMWIIEDACHAPGGFFKDSKNDIQKCGNGKFADLAIFSFHPVKHIATGEGGMVTTNNKLLYEKLLRLRTHGITRDPSHFINEVEFARAEPEALGVDFPGWYMEMQELGFNYRLTDFQAALGLSQLSRAEGGISRRRTIASLYEKVFSKKPFIKRQSGLEEGHAYHLYVMEVENRIGLYNYLRSKNVFTQIHYIPCHLMPYYKQFGWKEGDLPNAEEYYSRCISLPMFPNLMDDELDYIISNVIEFYK